MNKFKFLVLLVLMVSFTHIHALPNKVIVVRHGEKATGVHLDNKGWQRAAALISYFGASSHFSIDPRWQVSDTSAVFSPPFAIYAPRPEANDCVRPLETTIPLAQELGLPVHICYGRNQLAELAHLILTTPQNDGKEILIIYEHHRIPDLINQLILQAGGNILNLAAYPDNRFDLVYVIDYMGNPSVFDTPYKVVSAGGNISLTATLQELMFGDDTSLPTSNFPLN
jgi:hypothetical protein